MKKLFALALFIYSSTALAVKPTCESTAWPSPVNCVLVSYPNPVGGTIDMLDWMTMDPTLRDKNYMSPGTMGSHLVNNKIIYSKFTPTGEYMDVWTYDNDYIYFYATSSPNDTVKAINETDTPWTLRTAQLGFPGTRLVSIGAHWQEIKDCNSGPPILSGNLIVEIWGPYTTTFKGNIGTQETVVMKEYWDCHGTETNSCTQLEEFTYAKPYGWVSWSDSTAPNRDGNFQFALGGPFDSCVAGVTNVLDWCIYPSIFWTPTNPTNIPVGPRSSLASKNTIDFLQPIRFKHFPITTSNVNGIVFGPDYMIEYLTVIFVQGNKTYETGTDRIHGLFFLEGLQPGPAMIYYYGGALGGWGGQTSVTLVRGLNAVVINLW